MWRATIKPVLNFEHITYGYTATPLLHDVSLSIAPGEHVALLGINGAGKSTLLRMALGFLRPQSGTVMLDDLNPAQEDQARAVRRHIGYVGQNPDTMMVAVTVEDEVAFGPENLGLPRAELRARVDEALAAVGLTGLEKRDPATLSGGQKQRVVIAGALAMHPDYLLLDEPCSMLDPQARIQVLALVDDAAAAGKGILHITHDLNQASRADRICVLADGAIAFDGSPQELMTHQADFAAWGIAVPCEGAPECAHTLTTQVTSAQETEASASCAAACKGQPLFALEDVSVNYSSAGSAPVSALSHVELSIAQNSFTLIEGCTGSGKSTLLKVLAGLYPADEGSARFLGAPLTAASARGHVGLVFQNPEESLFAETVRDDVAFGPHNFGLDRAAALAVADATLARVGLDPERYGARLPFTLSGGEARRAAFAGVLAFEPQVLLADEPTAGLDAPARARVIALLAEYVASGQGSVVVVSHDPADFEAFATARYRLQEGALVETDAAKSAHGALAETDAAKSAHGALADATPAGGERS